MATAALRLSQKTFGQLLKTQTRSLATSSASRAFARSSALRPSAVNATCSRVAAARAFSTSRVAFEEATTPAAAEGGAARSEEVGEVRDGGRTVFFGNLPFFTDKEGFQKLLHEFGTFENVRWMTARSGAPLCHVTFTDAANASALVESSMQEPFYYGGRALRVNIATHRPGFNPNAPREGGERREPRARTPLTFPPSNRVYFKDFVGDTIQLRDWLGEHAQYVDHARFSTDRTTGEKRSVGLIIFTSTERAQDCIRDKKNVAGPDGTPVYLRFAQEHTLERQQQFAEARKRKEQQQQQSAESD
ncbi:hypothetical protein BKA70DRAFT_1387243 [Coprinopsis sp. MPI-PUGE-AT-0042]|nr:hypothetical protein BKA70DRAFT_1387243 [Coprinopsis sp. MPI-PUGE-AT-0042]